MGDPNQHPCLASLPAIFVRAMKGIAVLVDSFLGLSSTRPMAALASSAHGRSASNTSGRHSVQAIAGTTAAETERFRIFFCPSSLLTAMPCCCCSAL